MMLASKETKKLSKWVTVTERKVRVKGREELEIFHSLSLADYVGVVAVDGSGRIPLVRQYRPALECWTIELPGGMLEHGESPEVCAQRELAEEVGRAPVGLLQSFPCLSPDTGRLENRLWGFFTEISVCTDPKWTPEAGVEPFFVARHELQKMIVSGEFNHALHVALIGLSLVMGFLDFKDDQ